MDERQSKLLKEIVESYIKTVKPVGSQALCKKFKLSSATIRNEMAILEKMGYLEKNHISSGRIPSEKGYKYYVSNLMKPKELNGEDMLKLQTIFHNQTLQINDAITKCMEIIAELTNYTSVVLGKSSSDNNLQQVSIIPVDNNQVIALVCTNKGIVENKKFKLPDNIFVEELVKTCEIINKMLIGTPIDEVSQRLEFDVKPIISKTIKQYETVYGIFYDAFSNFAHNNQNVFFSGKSNILKQPEYDNIDEIKKIIGKFEDESLVRKIEENGEGVNVYIGEESDFDPNVTIIKSKYNINGEEGTIAIVGPKRMQYDRVIGLLEYLNKEISDCEK
ncbi:MAG TPA: heat-inducible transcription repressor HrcA [Firmicutes bacterium]|nr:heat-inducible transcription repressor HrcA [Bacillota bacterium]